MFLNDVVVGLAILALGFLLLKNLGVIDQPLGFDVSDE
jgi:hypothetical protein